MKRILWNREVKLDKNEKIVYMSPTKFLSQTPSVRGYKKGEPIPPASKNKASDFTKSSLHFIKEQINKKEKVDVPSLDYSNMYYGYPTHEGRHRAQVARMMHKRRIPVIVKRY
jgi:hypothetical protein